MKPYRLLVLLGLIVSLPAQAESFEFTAAYRGIFSAYSWINIADISLDQQPGEMRMTASSERHNFVETLYPFRYRYISLHDAQSSELFYRYEEARERKEMALFFNRSSDNIDKYERRELLKVAEVDPEDEYAEVEEPKPLSGEPIPATLSRRYQLDERLRYQGPLNGRLGEGVFDQLAALSHIRSWPWEQQGELRFTATNGKRLMQYALRLDGREWLEDESGRREALRVRLERVPEKDDDREYNPFWIWLAVDDRSPLQFRYEHRFGVFLIKRQASGSLSG